MTRPVSYRPPPRTQSYSWQGEVAKHDPHYQDPQPAYEFSGGRVFKDTDRSENGIYKRS